MLRPLLLLDIDGTLAHTVPMADNAALDWDQWVTAAGAHPPVKGVFHLVNELFQRGVDIVIVTGRSEAHRQETLRWLHEHFVPYTYLLMRPLGNEEPPAVIKAALLRMIGLDRPPFTILLAIDDDKDVVDMWESEFGIPTLHVQPRGQP